MDETGPRRWVTMIRHAMHTFAGALWLVGLVGAVRHGGATRTLQVGGAGLLLVVYLAGLVVQRRRPVRARSRAIGGSWVAALLLVWAALAGLGVGWAWLCFPILFLVLFIVPAPACWLVVLAAASWAALSPLVRGDAVTSGSVIGPLFGAGFAVVVAQVFAQLRRDADTQRRLTDQVAALAADQARVAEREAIARDLHDTLAQGLNSIVMLSRAGRSRHPDAAEVMDGIEQVARENLARTRTMVRQLAPPEQRSLAGEVQGVVAQAEQEQRILGTRLSLEFRTDGTPRPVGAAVAQATVMAARTLVANVVQHAGAERCVVSLSWLDEELCLDVVDDGRGFDESAVGPDSFGLRAVRSRMDEVGGRVEVETALGEGTSVGLVVPLADAEQAGSGARRSDG